MNKVFVNTIIQQKTNILLTPAVAILQNGPTKSEYVSPSRLLIRLKSKYFYLNIHFQR